MTATDRFADPHSMDKLAEIAVKVGLNLQEGQDLLITADIAMAGMVRKVTEQAYRHGAGLVTTYYEDEITTLARYTYGSEVSFSRDRPWLHSGFAEAMKDGKTARLRIIGENPFLLQGQEGWKLKSAQQAFGEARKSWLDIITSFETNWSIIPYATEGWAKAVFPDDPDAVAKLWDAIFKACRVDASVSDPLEAWKTHNAHLHERLTFLDGKRYSALHFKSKETDLTVGLADGHAWGGGGGQTLQGVFSNPNIPTEEVFTTPHAFKVDGYARSTKPLSYNGSMIEDIRVVFKEGRIVEAACSKGEDIFKSILDTDEGARRLGEVALVPHSSPISSSGILFFETLFDENAASHIALGQSYRKCLHDSEGLGGEALLARGANASLVHVDWMIGDGDTDVDGINQDGTSEPVMRNGEWAV